MGLIPLNLLGKSFVNGVCKRGEPEEYCRYFSEDDSPACLKLTEFRLEIDNQVELFLKTGSKLQLPLGDNCSGCAP